MTQAFVLDTLTALRQKEPSKSQRRANQSDTLVYRKINIFRGNPNAQPLCQLIYWRRDYESHGVREESMRSEMDDKEPPRRTVSGRRGIINGYSKASLHRMKRQLRNMFPAKVFLTLTYGADFPLDGRLIKKHWAAFQTWLKNQGVTSGVWIIEFQERGVLHFHVLLMERVNIARCQAHWNKII